MAHFLFRNYPCTDPEGGQGSGHPIPLKNNKAIGSLSKLDQIPWKTSEAPMMVGL